MSTDALNDTAPVKMTPVKLSRNYRPYNTFEIVGYHKPAVTVRNVLGKEVELEPAAFIDGKGAPPPQAGVGFDDKIWAGTVVRFTSEEVKHIRANGIGDIELED